MFPGKELPFWKYTYSHCPKNKILLYFYIQTPFTYSSPSCRRSMFLLSLLPRLVLRKIIPSLKTTGKAIINSSHKHPLTVQLWKSRTNRFKRPFVPKASYFWNSLSGDVFLSRAFSNPSSPATTNFVFSPSRPLWYFSI